MNKPRWFFFLMLTLWIAACQPAATTAQPTAASPVQGITAPAVPPTQEKPTVSQTPDVKTDFAPAKDDASMTRGKFFVDSAMLTPVDGKPGYYTIQVEGSLPTPCNAPRIVVRPPDSSNKIVVDAYTVVSADRICTQVIKPFAGAVAQIGGYPSGKYSVVVDTTPAGEFSVP